MRISSKTKMTRGFIALFVVVLLRRKDVSCTITNGPSNDVAEVGGQAIFNCTSDTAIQHWSLVRSRDDVGTPSAQNIAINCVIQSGFTTHYEVDRPGGNNSICNLVVKAISMQQAGIYACSDIGNGLAAILTVIDPIPVITRNSTTAQEAAVEGESVMFLCVLNYNGTIEPTPTLRPYFYWTNSTGHNVTSYNDSTTENMAVSQLVVAAGRENITPYTCHVYLKLNPPTTPLYASNIPTVNSIATSSNIEVLYYPQITSITSTVSPSDNCVYKEETLMCTADANPQAEYEWLDLSNNNVTSGASKFISTAGQYQCIAFNEIRAERYNDTTIKNLTTCISPNNVTINGTGCVSNSCTCRNHTLESLTLKCTANGYPEPTYQWWSDVPINEYRENNQTIIVITDGDYNCTASNKYGDQRHNDTASIRVSECTRGPKRPNLWYLFLLFLIFPVVGGACGIGFAIRYGREQRNIAYNKSFPFLKKMLPFMNENANGTTCERVGWIFLYLLMSITVGIVMIPYMLIKVNCNRREGFCKKKVSEQRQNSNPIGTAHGENVATPTDVKDKNESPRKVEGKGETEENDKMPSDVKVKNVGKKEEKKKKTAPRYK